MPFTLTGGMVREHRQRLGINQAELARALGYTPAAICKWERRKEHSIPRTQYQRVLDYFNARKDALEAQHAATLRLMLG